MREYLREMESVRQMVVALWEGRAPRLNGRKVTEREVKHALRSLLSELNRRHVFAAHPAVKKLTAMDFEEDMEWLREAWVGMNELVHEVETAAEPLAPHRKR